VSGIISNNNVLYGYSNTYPSVSAISPSSGTNAGGQVVTITGAGFTSDATVMFGSYTVAATDITFNSSGSITCNTPKDTGYTSGTDSVPITVTVSGIISNNDVNYTYSSTAPYISAISPAVGTTYGGQVVTLFVSNYLSPATVTFGSTIFTDVTYDSSTETITVSSPSGTDGTPAEIKFTSNTIDSNSMPYGYSTGYPGILTISPASGTYLGGQSVTINGSGFGTTTTGVTIMFGSYAVAVTDITSITNYVIECNTPSVLLGESDEPFDVIVTTNSNSIPSNNTVTYYYSSSDNPEITSMVPSSGTINGGQLVTISGSGFGGATVTFGTQIVSTLANSNDSEITFITPKQVGSSTTVTIYVAVTGTTTATTTYTYSSEALSITAINPASGTSNGEQFVTITGQGFNSISVVAFLSTVMYNSVYPIANPTVISYSDSQITFATPSSTLMGTGPFYVMVSSSGDAATAITSNYKVYAYSSTAPSISSISQSSGTSNGGQLVTITGQAFTSAYGVVFLAPYTGTLANPTVISYSDSQIIFATPSSTTMGNGPFYVMVSSSRDATTAITSNYKTYNYSSTAPSITAINPTSGTTNGGQLVTITGENLAGTTSVYFVTSSGTIYSTGDLTITSAGLTCSTPENTAGTSEQVNVIVIDSTGIDSNHIPYTYSSTAPSITSMIPTSGTSNGGQLVTITGKYFPTYPYVVFTPSTSSSTSSSFYLKTGVVYSDGQITFTTPSSTLAEDDGPFDVMVASSNDATTAITSNYKEYAFSSTAPLINSMNPTSGTTDGGQKVTIKGSNFISTDVVAVLSSGAYTYPTIGSVSTSQIMFTTSYAATDGDVSVMVATSKDQTDDTTITSNYQTYNYTYTSPAILNLSQISGTTLGGQLVTIYGTHFANTYTVVFGNAIAKHLFISSTQISCTTPAGTGKVDVSIYDKYLSDNSNVKTYTYLSTSPTLSSISQISGTINGGQLVTVYGTSLSDAICVTIGNINVTDFIYNDSENAITFATPAGSGLVDVQVFTGYGNGWVRSSTTDSYAWQSVAISSNGTSTDSVSYQTAVVYGGGIYTSSNHGYSWASNASAPTADWQSVAISSDGTYQIAVINGGGIYISSTSGQTWSISSAPSTSTTYWQSVAISSDGMYQTAVANGGGIWMSSNSGGDWGPSIAPGIYNWKSVAISSDGMYQTAVVNGGGIYTYNSKIFGTTWTLNKTAPYTSTTYWQSVTMSSDGTYQTAVVNGGGIYTSSDSGQTWASTSYAPTTDWQSVASSSSTGQYQTACSTSSGVYTSSDHGLTWSQTDLSIDNWVGVAISSDGTNQTAIISGGGIYIGVPTSSNYFNYAYLSTTPTISSISQSSGTTSGQQLIQITGTNFTSTSASTSAVAFVSSSTGKYVNATNLTITSTQITCTTPAGTGPAYVIVTSDDTSNAITSNYKTYTYSSTAPTISSISQSSGTLNGMQFITITGTNFTSTSTVAFVSSLTGIPLNATNLTITLSTYDTITCYTPPGTGSAYVIVTSDAITSSYKLYNYSSTAPTISGISPNSGTSNGMQLITITGTNFTSTSTVEFLTTSTGSSSPATILTTTSTQITCTTPTDAAGSVDVIVTANTITSNSETYTYSSTAPYMSSISQTSGTTEGGQLVTITGTNFSNATSTTGSTYAVAVAFGTSNATDLTVVSSTSITCYTPSGNGTLVNVIVDVNDWPQSSADWSQSSASTSLGWTAIAVSSTGQYQTGVINNGTINNETIYYSSDYGSSWTNATSLLTQTHLTSVSMTADGKYQAACIGLSVNQGSVWESANYGESWTLANANIFDCTSISISSDTGQYQTFVAVNNSGSFGGIYYSTDTGTTWSLSTASSSLTWSSVSVSSDGTYQTAVANGGGIWTSNNSDGNYGATWLNVSSDTTAWTSVSISSDGLYQTAVANGGGIWTSSTSGSIWTQMKTDDNVWVSVSVSSTGQYQIACVTGGSVYTSSNYGASWIQNTSTPVTGSWSGVAISSEGTYQTAVDNAGGGIYIGVPISSNYTTYAYSSSYPSISSIVPSSGTSAGEQLITITGTNFSGVSVTIGGNPVTNLKIQGTNNNIITCTTPANTASTVGQVEVIVTSSDKVTSNSEPYTYLSGYPYITDVYPTYGTTAGGQLVTITGTGFTNAKYVAFAIASTSLYSYATILNITDTEITCYTPLGSGPVYVTVIISDIPSNVKPYTYLADAPVVSSIIPSSGTLTGGQLITIEGTYLSNAFVTIGSIVATNLVVTDDAKITCTTPAGLSYGTVNLIVVSGNIGTTWTQTNAQASNWQSSSLSSSGQYQTAVIYGGYIWTSNNYGTSWTSHNNTTYYCNSVSISASGQYQTAVTNGAGIYTSNNLGVSWSQNLNAPYTSSTIWTSVSISGSGQYQTAVTNGEGIYTSNNYGAGWQLANAPTTYNWKSVSISSSTGLYQTAVIYGGSIYTSQDSGQTWTKTSAPSALWISVSISSDGTTQLAAVNGGYIYIWTTTEQTWIQTAAPFASWVSVSISSTGQFQTACSTNMGVYTSTDAGLTWAPTPDLSTDSHWAMVAISSDGTYQTAGVFGNYPQVGIYTSVVISNNEIYTYSNTAPAVSSISPISGTTLGDTQITILGSNLSTNTIVTIGSNLATISSSPTPTAGSITCTVPASTLESIYGPVGVTVLYCNYGTVWIQTSDLVTGLQSISLSSTGQYQTAVAYEGGIYTSENYGTTWTLQTIKLPATANWLSVSISESGRCQTAVASLGGIYISTDYGNVWAENLSMELPTNANWYSVSISESGQYQTAVVYGGGIYMSIDFGSTWALNTYAPTAANWQSVSISSSSGLYQTAVVNGGGIYTSGDLGTTWTLNTSAPYTSTTHWQSVSVSSDGMYQTAVIKGGGIYTYDNTEDTWSPVTTGDLPSVAQWFSVSLSASGQYQTACSTDNGVYTSSTHGSQWAQTDLSTANKWSAVSLSYNGMYQSVVCGTGIYTSVPTSSNSETYTYIYYPSITEDVSPNTGTTYGGQLVTITGTNLLNAIVTIGSTVATDLNITDDGTTITCNTPAYSTSATVDVLAVGGNYGTTWTQTSEIATNWQSVSVSLTGQYQTAVVYGGGIYTSNNYGTSWTLQTGAPTKAYWYSVSISSSGQYQIACANLGSVYTSNTYGTSWIQQTGLPAKAYWRSVAISSDGTIQTAVIYGQGIWTYNYNNTDPVWTQQTSGVPDNTYWYSVSMSSYDGTYQTAVVSGGGIYTSATVGQVWALNLSAPTTANWHSVSLSTDGMYQTAVAYNGGIWTSSNYGTNWTINASTELPAIAQWFSVSLSLSGRYQTACSYDNGVYRSSNYGKNWVKTDLSTNNRWSAVSLSSDGMYQTALIFGTGIYTSVTISNSETYMYSSGEPYISSISQISGTTGGGQLVTITGQNFSSTSTVDFGKSSISSGTDFSINAEGTSITCTTPTGTDGVSVNVMVTSNNVPSNYKTYAYSSSTTVPTMTTISQIYGTPDGGQFITITGTNFSTASTVAFVTVSDGIQTSYPATNPIVTITAGTTTDTITCYTPAGIDGTVDVIVTYDATTDSVTSNYTTYTYLSTATTISGIFPNYGTTKGGQLVTIIGANFSTTSTVAFGTTTIISAKLTINSEGTKITCISPTSSIDDTVDIIVTSSNITSNSSLYTYSSTAPSISSIVPMAGTTLGGQLVTVTVTNASSVTDVTIGTNSIDSDNLTINTADGTITFYTPSSTTQGPVDIVAIAGNYGSTWSESFSGEGVAAVAISSTGQYQTGIQFTTLAVSTNYGQSWTIVSPPTTALTSVAMSASGQYQTICGYGGTGGISMSDDYGATWAITSAGRSAAWTSISISSDGKIQTAVNNGGYGIWVYNYNTNATWTQTSADATLVWQSVSISSDGSIQTAVVNGGGIWLSINSGGTWKQTSAPSSAWYSVSISSTGRFQTAVVYGGGIWMSANSGGTWTKTHALTKNWYSVSISSSGKYQTAGIQANDYLYTSADYGTSWAPTGPKTGWTSVAISSNGMYRIASEYSYGNVYMSAPTYSNSKPYIYSDVAPTITSITPKFGTITGGMPIIITGTYLFNTYSVAFGPGSFATILSIHPSGTQISCITPSSSIYGPVDVIVTTDNGITSNSKTYTYFENPIIELITPGSGSINGGQTITILGKNFLSGTDEQGVVTIGGNTVTATAITQYTNNKITFTVPEASSTGPVPVIVTVDAVASNIKSYTYINNPSITSITPSSGSITGGQSIIIIGKNLLNASVTIGANSVTNLHIVSSTKITCTVPASSTLTAGTVTLTVSVVGTTSATMPYTYIYDPTITSINPSSGTTVGGQSISITGTNLRNAIVTIGDKHVLNLIVVSSTQINCTTPSGNAGQAKLIVSVAGTTSAIATYTYTEIVISNICFPAGTHITTDQGNIPIEQINPDIHTIHTNQIVAITKTITQDKYLVCFERHSLGFNKPTKPTVTSKNHKVYYKGEMIKAYRFLKQFKHVTEVEYNGDVLYNVLMEKHDKLKVNNLTFETLDPKNIIAKLYTSGFDEEYKNKIIAMINNSIMQKDHRLYKSIINRIVNDKNLSTCFEEYEYEDDEYEYEDEEDQEYREDLDQEYREDLDQEYREDLDQEYREDLDQEYREDLDQEYREDLDQDQSHDRIDNDVAENTYNTQAVNLKVKINFDNMNLQSKMDKYIKTNQNKDKTDEIVKKKDFLNVKKEEKEEKEEKEKMEQMRERSKKMLEIKQNKITQSIVDKSETYRRVHLSKKNCTFKRGFRVDK
jgi:hypothetical protein